MKYFEMRKQAKKGFTLVEVIVVIVIIAILAAIAIPALTGYIKKAEEKAAIADARHIATALQTISIESFATGGRIYKDCDINGKVRLTGGHNDPNKVMSTKSYLDMINELTGEKYTADNFAKTPYGGHIYYSPETVSTGQGKQSVLQSFVYVTDDKKTKVTYDKGEYKVEKI